MTLKEKYKLGRKYLKEGKSELADRMFDLCIVHLSKATINGEEVIDGASLDRWKVRVWTQIEKAGFLPD
jgi:hypothetical protein